MKYASCAKAFERFKIDCDGTFIIGVSSTDKAGP
jgi:hypothetical protein